MQWGYPVVLGDFLAHKPKNSSVSAHVRNPMVNRTCNDFIKAFPDLKMKLEYALQIDLDTDGVLEDEHGNKRALTAEEKE